MSELEVISNEHELIAQAMLQTRGDLGKTSRFDSVPYNAMALRNVVRDHPEIRRRYQQLLSFELQEKGLHIAERILKMAELQEKAFGGEIEYEDELGNTATMQVPPDPKMVIELSKEISRLIAEGKSQNMSAKSAVIIASKEDAEEILKNFLDS
jgi:hypothetical protein